MALQPHLVCSLAAISSGYIHVFSYIISMGIILESCPCAQGLEIAMLDGTLWTELPKTINFLGQLQAHDPVYGGGWPVDELGYFTILYISPLCARTKAPLQRLKKRSSGFKLFARNPKYCELYVYQTVALSPRQI